MHYKKKAQNNSSKKTSHPKTLQDFHTTQKNLQMFIQYRMKNEIKVTTLAKAE